MHPHQIANFEKLELSFSMKTQELNRLSAEIEAYGRKISEKQIEKSRLEEMVKEEEKKLSIRKTNANADELDLVGVEKRVKENISKKVKEEIDKLLGVSQFGEFKNALKI